jgi:hypothetical protein
MAKYFEVITLFGIFICLAVTDLTIYYSYGRTHSLIPFYISLALTIVVGVMTVLALYEVFKHRNDKEPW